MGGGGGDFISAERINATLLWFTLKTSDRQVSSYRPRTCSYYLKLRRHVIVVA